MEEIKKEAVFLSLFLLLTVIVIVVFLRNKRSIQSFATTNEINDEMAAQFRLIKDFEFPDSQELYGNAKEILPNMEIIKKYRDSANSLLGPIQESVIKDSDAKSKEIDKLNEYINSMGHYAQNDYFNKFNTRNIQTIKSHNNGMELSVAKTDIGPKRDYMVRVNNGCLKVPFTNDANVVPCNSSDPDQVFSLDNVFNESEYRAKMDKAYPQLEDLGKVKYPFSILRAKSNGNCLKNFHGSVSIEPCREYEGQRWASSENPGGLCPLK